MSEHDTPREVRSAAQQPLPFDDEADRPIPFALTARARRAVAPDALPRLRVVEAPDVGEDDPSDTRPARARALRRAGLGVADIARTLAVDPLLVRVWTGAGPGPADLAAGGANAAVGVPDDLDGDAEPDDEDTRRRRQARADAAAEASRRLAQDPAFAAGVGLLAGLAEVDTHAVTVPLTAPAVGRRLLAWLLPETGLSPERVRVVLRLGRAVAADRARHRWSDQLGVPLEQISFGRSRDALEHESALLRLADPLLAAAVAGWCDALVTPSGDDLDLAF